MDTSPSLPIPRLRLTRHSPPSRADTLNTPVAGPSHSRPSPDTLRAQLYDDEDTEATPRMPAARIADSPEAPAAPALPLDTPAARLRMVLSRVPNNKSPPRASTSRLPEPRTPSEPDSDLDPPYSIIATPSIAKESLREIFSHALRRSEATPQKQKGRARRNSVGPASEVDPSPRIERVQHERAGNKGKRKSMSDEEAEHLSNISRRSEESSRSSHSKAARWNALTAALNGTHSNTMPPTPPPERMVTDMTMPPSDTSTDTATLLRELDRPGHESTPPHVTSTPTRTLQMSEQFNGQSNLLDGDSEMRKALGGLDSYEGDSLANGHAPPFPPSHSKFTSPPSTRPTSWSARPKPDSPGTSRPPSASPGRPLSWSANQKSDPVSPGRPLSWNSHSKSHSAHNLQMPLGRRGSEELEHSTSSLGSSRASSSSQSAADYKERQEDLARDRLRERERLWNHPPPKSPAHAQHFANGRNSPAHAHTLSRRGSAASLTSTDDGRSSRASSSSAMSQAEQRERVKELELERQREREHGWNKSRNASSKTLNRSASSLSLHPHERTRTLSSVMQHTPPRPDSAQSFLSPHAHTPAQPRRSLSRQSSTSSLRSAASGHSRAGSPTGSVSVEPEEEKEVEHERERNWNSPRPKWSEQPHHHGRSPSPMPAPTPPTVGPRERKDSTASLAQVSGRQRTQSLRSSPVPAASAHARTRTQSSIPADLKGKAPLNPRSPAHALNAPGKSPEPPSRSPSPVHPARADGEARPHTPGHRSRFGWTFPANRMPLPPLELDTEPDEPEKPRTATTARLALKSPAAGGHLPRPASALGDAPASRRGHRRSVTELSKPTGPVPPAARGGERGDEEDGIHIEVDTGSDSEPDEDEDAETESPFPSFHAESQMDAVFASDEDSPPATSTPTARPVPLPLSAPSSPSPPTQPRHNDTHANDGGAPSKVMRPASPPATPADTTPAPVFTLQTPPRRSPGNGSSTTSSAKLEFKTPSPPRGMPDLPDPPSFATDEGDGEDDHTPVMTSAPGNLTMMKTPRPPGAWAATPDVRHTDANATAEGSSASSVLVNTPDGPAKVDVVATPGPGAPNTNTNANTTATWPRTPAPPGAWLQTPGGPASVRRRSVLKVRFDVESETTASDVGEREPSAEGRRRALPAEWNPDSSAEGALAMPPVAVPSGSADGKEAPGTPLPPRRESAASRPFRSPGSVSVRIVDAFGREIKPEQEEQAPRAPKETRQEVPARPKTPERKAQQSKTGSATPSTPRSRSTVRIVDAMGREVEEPEPVASGSRDARREPEGGPPADASIAVVEDEGSSLFSVDMPTPTSHNEALALMREKVQDMKKEARQAEKSCRALAVDDGRARTLEDASSRARSARRSISQELQRVEGAGAEKSRASRYGPLRESMRRSTSRFLPSAMSGARVKLPWSRGAWLFWVLVLVQLGLCVIMYRLSNMRARRLFLTTYYDPFYAELYLFARTPDASDPSAIPPYPSWYEIPARVVRGGWQAALQDVWGGVRCAVWLGTCGQAAPEVWNNAGLGLAQARWPPV